VITFIDTPGHEAFSMMRSRGANVTDIVILVVAADDSVMAQTREAISHAKAAGVPIIVAINKIDKPGSNPEKPKQDLANLDLLPEEWGGTTMFIPVSALKRTNLDKLLESILLQAEIMELKANQDVHASGTILESKLDKGRGNVVSLLVKRGTLRVGDSILAGTCQGKIKAMLDDKGNRVKETLPGYAVEVLGFEALPSAGDPFHAGMTENDAKIVIEQRINEQKAKAQAAHLRPTLDQLYAKLQAGEIKELSLILKGDVFGSVEALRESLEKLSNEKVQIKIIHSAAGGITESDIHLALASNAIIIGFNVRPETKARQFAEEKAVEIKCYNIIYELIDDVKKAMEGLLDKKESEKFLGRAEVRQVFMIPKAGTIAGCSVIDGKLVRNSNVRLLRDSRVIYQGKLGSLKRFKDDAKEVQTGYECGLGIENYNDLKVGDIVEAFEIEMISQTM
jgi:translation initiation factor IF-2